MLSFNKKTKLVLGLLLFTSILLQLAEGKPKKKVYTDKLNLIRDFIEVNYPIKPDYYIKVETSTGWYQNFWQFYVTIGEVGAVDTSAAEWLKTEPEYVFEFHVSASYKLLEVRIYEFKKIKEEIKKVRAKLSKKAGIDVEEVRELLIEMGAKYPFGQGEIIKFPDGSLRIEDCGTEELKKNILKRKELWDFLGGGDVNIKSLAFAISADRKEDSIELSNLWWSLKVKVSKIQYRIHIEPFHGYIINIEIEN